MPGGSHPATVAAARAATYAPGAVAAAVQQVLAPFGGAAGILGGRTRVLLTPNVLRPAHPDEAVTTHPEVIKAVAREFRAAGAHVAVGDSPGGNPGSVQPAFEKTGIAAACADLGLELINFQEAPPVSVTLPYSPAGAIRIARAVADAELIVNLPKLKTHTLTQMTCALKNPYGYIPGFLKGTLHTVAPRVDAFVSLVCALWAVYPPAFSLVDAVVGMEGEGPSGGAPRPVGWILGASDPVALDAVCAWAMGLDPARVELIREAVKRGLGTGGIDAIRLVNAAWPDLKVEGFVPARVSRAARYAPRWLVGLLAPVVRRLFWVRPCVIPEVCERCLRCVRSCPTGAMQAGPAGTAPRLAAPRQCISCLCCQEICPARAIELRRSLIVSQFLGASPDAPARKPCPPKTDN